MLACSPPGQTARHENYDLSVHYTDTPKGRED